ncbi:hypothetical protein K502DRAFT_345484 [Neoconidiobolus thromboides FSU 785]|nr:hypothetical protein K502DRAFT_345484 [Neoconidiobolus thromboides FSU 785]
MQDFEVLLKQEIYNEIEASEDIKLLQYKEKFPLDKIKHWLLTDLFLFIQNGQAYFNNKILSLLQQIQLDSDSEYLLTHQNLQISTKRIRNRRYEYMTQVLINKDYFSEREIIKREPDLFYYYLPNYKIKFQNEPKLSERLIMNWEQDIINQKIDEAKSRQEDQWEEEEEEEEEEGEEGVIEEKKEEKENIEEGLDGELTEEEFELRKEELIKVMKERFIGGLDKTFDYNKIDQDEIG